MTIFSPIILIIPFLCLTIWMAFKSKAYRRCWRIVAVLMCLAIAGLVLTEVLSPSYIREDGVVVEPFGAMLLVMWTIIFTELAATILLLFELYRCFRDGSLKSGCCKIKAKWLK
jgi:hypothetical protein